MAEQVADYVSPIADSAGHLKFNVAAAAQELGIAQIAVDRQEYEDFVRHHIECERLGTELSEAAKELLRYETRAAYQRLGAAIQAFDAHQWPDIEASHNGRSATQNDSSGADNG